MSIAWKYYAAENARWPELHAAHCSEAEAIAASRALAGTDWLIGPPPHIEWTIGNWSYAIDDLIIFSADSLNWLTVAHELAHTWQYFDDVVIGHNAEHRARVDAICRTIIRNGWHHGKMRLSKFAIRAGRQPRQPQWFYARLVAKATKRALRARARRKSQRSNPQPTKERT